MHEIVKSTLVDKYQLLEKLAYGGMAEIYLAKLVGAAAFTRFFAVKRILPHLDSDASFRQMFEREAQISANLNHANIVRTVDFLQQKDGCYLVMEYINGKSLNETIAQLKSLERRLSIEMALNLGLEVLKGLDYAHTRVDEKGKLLQIMHRDISPQNIMLAYDGSLKIIDFGVAKPTGEDKFTKTGVVKGKFAYMSPEQASARALDARTDIFSLALVLYEMLGLSRAYSGSGEIQLLKAARTGEVKPLREVDPQIPEEIEKIVMKGLAKNPNDRYTSALEFAVEIQNCLNGREIKITQLDLAKLMAEMFPEDIRKSAAKLSYWLSADSETLISTPTTEVMQNRESDKQGKGNFGQFIQRPSKGVSAFRYKIKSENVFFVMKLAAVTFFLLLYYSKFGDSAKRGLAQFLGTKNSQESRDTSHP